MDQIRNTIMQHEALFKEQVQTLHKLYNIQKLAMQEIRRIYSQALACSSKGFVLVDDKYGGSVLDGKHLLPAYATGEAYKDESLNLSLHPFYALDHKGCGSGWMDSRGVETLQTAQSKPIRNFDLERLPEEYKDESEYQIELNSSKMSDENSNLFKRTTSADGNSSVGANLSVLQMDSTSSEQNNPKAKLRVLSVNGQEILQNCDRVSEDKADRTDIKKFDLSFPSPNSTSENKTSQDFPRKYLPAVAKSDPCQYSRHIEKQTLLHQGSVNFMTQKYNPLDSGKDGLENFPAQANGHVVEGFFPKNPAICSQGSSTLDSVQCDCKGFSIQKSLSLKTNSISGKLDPNPFPLATETSTCHKDENPNDSDNGSNSVHSHYTKSCEDKNISIHLEDTPGPGNSFCEAVQTSHDEGQAVQSKCEEVPQTQVIKDGFKASVSSTLFDSEIKHIKSSMYSNSKFTNVAVPEKPVFGREGNENLVDKSAQDEACESIAAEILLSMAPSMEQVDFHLHGTQTKVESRKSSKNDIISDKKWSLFQRRHANYCQDGGVSESLKWVKTVNRRRTARRPR